MSDDAIITPTESNSAWAERTGTRQYLGHNARGAEVRVGMGPGEFSPGELLKIALATCNTLSADHRLANALGEDFEANVICATLKNEEEERYSALDVQVVTDLSGLTGDQLATLTQRVEAAIERGCTVGHTLDKGAEVRLHLLDDRPEDVD
ncbi:MULTISPECIES: OsmC family protein [unclassified Actinomyces]|uniref:OsmC family protein n=1 Tax=unclassified Actinomyces TaxID=2609248 RepID=UPI0020174913|nr:MULTISPECIES: OsmC family protein [unclassified Actinomyces]MCL3778039.1 OsmC family protein [Actinomyces sp. AC-20-1]MCL3790777.1 OsmC family protein [Actinomyces sp. 187325]MCL3793155.1 OsmC family protein [Actinomyces sp. 186855]MCL3795483.1 OsmC family protein [Actinomyces sp. 217892]